MRVGIYVEWRKWHLRERYLDLADGYGSAPRTGPESCFVASKLS